MSDPKGPKESSESFDSSDYRRALGGFGTGVALVAAHDADGNAHGMIINSLTSVSLNPPIMLWCLARASSVFGIYANAPAFSLNILRSDDHEVARHYSRRGADRIIPLDQVCTMDSGAPVLTAAVASLDCRTRLRQSMGDHEVIYGDVVAYRGDPGVDALGFFRGRFVTLKSED